MRSRRDGPLAATTAGLVDQLTHCEPTSDPVTLNNHHAHILVMGQCFDIPPVFLCRAFSVAAPQAWNMDSFRRDLKTFLFHSVYGHAPGYGSIDSVMRPRSSGRGCNTSASVTVTVGHSTDTTVLCLCPVL